MFGLVTHGTLGPEFLRQVILKHRPQWANAPRKREWESRSNSMDQQHKKRISQLLTKSWHKGYRLGLSELGGGEDNFAPGYDVWGLIKWYWAKHKFDKFEGDLMRIAGADQFLFTKDTVSAAFWKHHIDNHFVSSMSNEKVCVGAPPIS